MSLPNPQPTLALEVSIIIPTLNEAANLPTCLKSIQQCDALNTAEVIICDGGSSDETLNIAAQSSATVVHAPRGRSRQMNAGARCARGTTLLFLHADTQLPPNAIRDISIATEKGFVTGCFERQFSDAGKILTLTSLMAGWRARKTFYAYGDQAIFIRRDIFTPLEGYRNLARFEDLDLAVRAKAWGRWAVLSGPIVSNSRRFGRFPLFRIIHDAWLTLMWLAGVIRE
jgi:rSAM/selenodomain-associated transferase 2